MGNRIVDRQRLEAPPPPPLVRVPIRQIRLDAMRKCRGCGRRFLPTDPKQWHCKATHRARAYYNRTKNNRMPKGMGAHSPRPRVQYSPRLCAPCLKMDPPVRTTFTPKFKGDDSCPKCHETPRWKRRSRRRSKA